MGFMLHVHLIITISLLKKHCVLYTCNTIHTVHSVCDKNIHQKTKPSCIYQE